jgi:hypothetical protein
MHEAVDSWDEWVGRNGSTGRLHGLQPHLQCDTRVSRETEADYRGDYQGARCGVELGEWRKQRGWEPKYEPAAS